MQVIQRQPSLVEDREDGQQGGGQALQGGKQCAQFLRIGTQKIELLAGERGEEGEEAFGLGGEGKTAHVEENQREAGKLRDHHPGETGAFAARKAVAPRPLECAAKRDAGTDGGSEPLPPAQRDHGCGAGHDDERERVDSREQQEALQALFGRTGGHGDSFTGQERMTIPAMAPRACTGARASQSGGMKSRIWILGVTAAAALVLTGCPEKRRPAGSTPAKPAQTAPAKASDATKAPEATGSLADYARNLSNAEKKATEVTGLDTLKKAVQQYQVLEGRFPNSLDELIAARFLPKLPAAPRGKRFIYDPRSGDVTVEALPPAAPAPESTAPEAVPAPVAPAQ